MIRYNANSSEILGKPQYDVLRGFGVWNFVSGFFMSLWVLLIILMLVLFVFLKAYPLAVFMLTFLFAMIFLTVYSFGIGRGIMQKKQTLPGFVDRLSRFGIVVFIAAYVLQIIMSICFYYLKFTVENNVVIIPNMYSLTHQLVVGALNTGLMIYIFLAMRKTFAATCIAEYIITASKNTDVQENNVNEPRMINLFEKWNPLYAYGRFMFFFGLISFASSIAAYFLGNNNAVNNQQMNQIFDASKTKSILLLSMGITPLVMMCGLGLSAMKEWARTMTVILHTIFMFLPILFLMGVFLGQYAVNLKIIYAIAIIIYSVLGFPLFHWCYFVIRTLSSPVVKYVCLRGGHDIE